MAKIELVFSEEDVEKMQTRVLSVGDGEAAGQLQARTALAVRLLHQAAKDREPVQAEPVNYMDSLLGCFTFSCACGRRFLGRWEEARYEAIDHVERHHSSVVIRRDLDILEDTIESLIVPNPLSNFSAKDRS